MASILLWIGLLQKVWGIQGSCIIITVVFTATALPSVVTTLSLPSTTAHVQPRGGRLMNEIQHSPPSAQSSVNVRVSHSFHRDANKHGGGSTRGDKIGVCTAVITVYSKMT